MVGAEERVIDAGAEIMQVCAAAGGSLSGEHGIGMEKKDMMPLIFSQDDVAQMQRIKDAFDPARTVQSGQSVSHRGPLHGAVCAARQGGRLVTVADFAIDGLTPRESVSPTTCRGTGAAPARR